MAHVRSILVYGLALCAVFLATPAEAGTPSRAIQELLGLPEPPATTPYIFVERKDDEVRGVIATVVPLEVEHVMEHVILCYGAFPEWFPLQKDAKYMGPVIDDKGTIYGSMEFPWPIGLRSFQANIEGTIDDSQSPTVYTIDFAHKPGTGNIKMMEGRWVAQAYGEDSTLVVYDSTIDFDTWVPAFLLARGTRQFLPAIMDRMGKRTGKCSPQHAPPGFEVPNP